MPLFRHSAVLFEQLEPTAVENVEGGAFRVVPSDGDGTSDHEQRWYLVALAKWQGDGSVSIDLQSQFGDGIWILGPTVGPADIEEGDADGPRVEAIVELTSLAPFVRGRVWASAAAPEGALPSWRAVIRIASDGPFKVLPADVPDLGQGSPG